MAEHTGSSRTDRRRLRVLDVMPGLDADGGTEQSLLALAPGLLDRGVDLHVAVLTGRQGLVPRLEELGVVVHDLSTARSLVDRVRALRSLVGSLQPDLLHASIFDATLPCQLAVLRRRTPLLITWANVNYGAERVRCRDSNRLTLEAYRFVEMVAGWTSRSWYHAVTAGVGRANAATLHVPLGRVLVAERGRCTTTADTDIAEVAATRSALGAEASDAVVLAIGRQDRQKAYPDLIERFDAVVDARPEARLWIAGRPGTDTPDIDAAVARMRHGDRVSLLGHRDDVTSLLQAADVVTCASWREGAAGALIEAMVMRRPVVTVRLAGLDGVFVDGENALVVERADLASGITRLIEDRALGERLAAAARLMCEERFTIEAAVDQLLDVYSTVAAAGADRSTASAASTIR